MKIMKTFISIIIGLLGVGTAYYFFKKKTTSSFTDDESGDGNVESFPIVEVDNIDYQYILNWLKSNKEKITSNSSLNIIPPSVVKANAIKSGLTNLSIDNILGVTIMDEDKNEPVVNVFFHYKTMAESLSDMLPSDRVFVQPIQ